MLKKSYSTDNSIALDANCLTYLYEAMEVGYDPLQDRDKVLANEKAAMMKIFLYVGNLYVLPCVKTEVKQIRQQLPLNGHLRLGDCLLREISNLDDNLVTQRMNQYLNLHSRRKDCRILAEAEIANLDFLLTFDRGFLAHLQNNTICVCLLSPATYLSRLNLPVGSKPKTTPSSQNPLSSMNWWKI
jgi:hypothetical protein